MSTLRISDAPLLPDVDGTEKIPTGGRGDYAVSIDQIKNFSQGGLPQQIEDHINDTSNPHQVTKEQVGLGNVDNTSDLDKPVSTATQEALDLKANTVDVDNALNLKADKSTTYTKTEVDQALDLKADLVGGVIPSEQLPSYVDDVIEVTTDTLPIVGESGKIYITTDTNRTWRWSGSQYVEISNGGISDSTIKLQTARKIANVDFDGTQDISIPHNNLVDRDVEGAHLATSILSSSGENQQDINDYTGAKWRNKAGGYDLNARVMLENGDIVQSVVAGNIVDPNTDMTGWIYSNDASQVKYGNQNQAQINARTATPYDYGAIGDGLAHPLSERYATLAEAQAVYPSATSLTEYIDGHALNAWWRGICANDRKLATCHGDFLVNTKISNVGLNTYLNPISTKRIDFDAHIKFQNVIGRGFEIISSRLCNFSGYMRLEDTGGEIWSNRTIDTLLYMEDFLHASFNWRVNFYYAKYLGFEAFSGASGLSGTTTNNNTSNLGEMLFNSCGHRFSVENFSFTARSDIGGSGTTDQRSILTLSANHNLGDLVDSFIQFNNKPYLITASTANTVTVYPWLTETDTTGTITISNGGDFRLRGPDSNNIKMSGGSSNCAICGAQEGFYVGAKIQRTNEANDIGLRLGNGVSGIQIGGTYLGVYFELNVFDVVKTNVTVEDALIVNPINLDPSKCHVFSPILSSTRKPNPTLINSFSIDYGSKTIGQRKLQYYDGLNPVATQTFKIGEPSFKIRSGASTITLADDLDIRRVFGIVDLEFEVFGVASNNGTSANTTIKHQAGYTINGVAGDLVIPPQNAPFKVSARLVNETDWRVYVFYAERPKGSKTHDWASLAVGEQQSTTLTVFGARLGDTVVASMDVALNGTSLRAEVTAANTVTVYHHNPTAAAVDVGSGTLTVKLL